MEYMMYENMSFPMEHKKHSFLRMISSLFVSCQKMRAFNMSFLLIIFCFASTYSFGQSTSKYTDPNWEKNSHWQGPKPEYDMSRSAILDHDSDVGGNDITVNDGITLTINSGKTLSTNTSFTVKEGGTLIVNGSLIGTDSGKELKFEKGALLINAGGNIDWAGTWNSNDDPSSIVIDGFACVGDHMSNKVAISGSGGMVVKGELNNDGGTIFGCSSDDDGCCVPPFCTLGSAAALPIELVSFEAEPTINKQVNLDWVTSAEINNAHFTIERSSDGNSFEEVIRVDGAGNSNSTISYHSYDEDPYTGQSYYRLKQTDHNGDFEYFNIISVYIEALDNVNMTVYPNPSDQNQIYADIEGSNEDSILKIVLIDMQGRTVFKKYIGLIGTTAEIYLDPSLTKGIYHVITIIGDKRLQQKFIRN